MESLHSQGVKSFNFVSIKATGERKEDYSSEVTASDVARNGPTQFPKAAEGLSLNLTFFKTLQKEIYI